MYLRRRSGSNVSFLKSGRIKRRWDGFVIWTSIHTVQKTDFNKMDSWLEYAGVTLMGLCERRYRWGGGFLIRWNGKKYKFEFEFMLKPMIKGISSWQNRGSLFYLPENIFSMHIYGKLTKSRHHVCVCCLFKATKDNSEGCDSGKDAMQFVTTFLQGQFPFPLRKSIATIS